MYSPILKNHNTKLVFDPSNPTVDDSEFERRTWTSREFRHILKEGVDLPASTLKSRVIGL